MLYVNTNNKADSVTAYRVLRAADLPAGQMYVPFQLQPLDEETLSAFLNQSFCGAVASVLNFFFSTGITQWDVELCAGRNIVSCRNLSHKLIVAETWHNPEGSYRFLEKALYEKLIGAPAKTVPAWVKVAIRIAVLFGIFTGLRDNIHTFDVTTNAWDSTTYLAALYARYLGLPVGSIIIGCSERSGYWGLIQKGELSASASEILDIHTLIHVAIGEEEAIRCRRLNEAGKTFYIDEDTDTPFNQYIFAAVVSQRRLESIMGSMWRTSQYLITPDTAVSYSALQDYRARAGESRDTLLFADRSPLQDVKPIQQATGLSFEQIGKNISIVKE